MGRNYHWTQEKSNQGFSLGNGEMKTGINGGNMKRFIILILLISAGISLFVYSQKKATEKRTKLTFLTWAALPELEKMKSWIDVFEKRHPNIKVELIHQNPEYERKLQTMIAGGTPPDIIRVSEWQFLAYVDKDVYLDLNRFVQSDAAFNLADFIPQSLDMYTYEEQLFCVPWVYQPIVLFYNQSLFDKEGLSYPSGDWTWDDFLSAARRLTKDKDGDGKIDQYGYSVEPAIFTWVSFIWQNGGEIIAKDGKWVWGEPRYIEKNAETIQFLIDLIHKYKVAPVPGSGTLETMGVSEMFQTGRLAMFSSAASACLQFKDMKFKWNIAGLPYKRCKASFIGGTGYGISKNSKHPEEAWEFIRFLCSPEIFTEGAKAGFLLPPRKSLFSSEIFLEKMPELNRRAFIKTAERSRTYPTCAPEWYLIKKKII